MKVAKVVPVQTVVSEKVEIVEEENEGLVSLLGKRVLVMSAGFYYLGDLVGVNGTCCKLADCWVIYSTKKFNPKDIGEKDKLPGQFWYVTTESIESFGEYNDKAT